MLLYGQTGWEEAQREAVVEGLVRARLVGSVTSTKRVAEGKRIFDLPGGGFCMTKVCCRHGCSDRAHLDSTSHVSDCCEYCPSAARVSSSSPFFNAREDKLPLHCSAQQVCPFACQGSTLHTLLGRPPACFPCT